MPISGILKKIKSTQTRLSTYHIGLVQAKAYRVLQQRTNSLLEPYGITSVGWAFLGLLYETEVVEGKGLRFSDIANALGVERPFITILADDLIEKKLVTELVLEDDRRVKIVMLTKAGSQFVKKTETMLRSKMKYLLANVSISDLMAYHRVLQGILKNDSKNN